MKPSAKKPAEHLITQTMRVRFSQPGVRASPQVKEMVADLRRRFCISRDTEIKQGKGYFDGRVTFTCEAPVQWLPGALVAFTRSKGHASTSLGPWLLDTEDV